MNSRKRMTALCAAVLVAFCFVAQPALADGDLGKLQHVIVVMQENHSFDNYFGALAYVPGGPYHSPSHFDSDDRDFDRRGPEGCRPDDNSCVDGLTCKVDDSGDFTCRNSNLDDDGSTVFSFHDARRCAIPDIDHGWIAVHQSANFAHPNDTFWHFLGDGFVRATDLTDQPDTGPETPFEDQTMSFYNQNELPFYYQLAQDFGLSDRYFSSTLGPTFPNRAYLSAATSFGHVTTNDTLPPPGGYKPATGTIYDLMDKNNVSWADYFQDVPQGGSFRNFTLTSADPHFLPYKLFLAQVTGAAGTPPLPQVSFVDPNFGFLAGNKLQSDEHPPTDIQRGQAFLSQVINAVRNGPYWKDTIIFLTYDENGGFYDHVRPPKAQQGHQRTPDGIAPGQCADASNPPASLMPGGGAQCDHNQLSATGTSVATAEELCPALTADPTGPFPAECASFDQLGFRVPLLAISAFSKKHYVSHVVSDHTSLLALIEKRFMTPVKTADSDHDEDHDHDGDHGDDPDRFVRPHLTNRDLFANTLEELFDFDHSPSLNTSVGSAAPPVNDCTPP
jgi:phospholipase C